MKNILVLLGIVLLGSFSSNGYSAALPPAPVYELRIYIPNEGKMPGLLARFRDHTCALFERHGMINVGYWTSADAKDGAKLYYVLQHRTRELAEQSWKAFRDDPDWVTAKAASEVNGSLVASAESIFMSQTDYSPIVQTLTGGAHIFELRTYTTNEGKLDTLDTRFRDHTIKLFARHGMTNLPYWHPLDTDKGAGHTLIYLLAHGSREAATKSWADFQADPEWIQARDASEKNGRILVQGGVKSVFLIPMDFSKLK